MNKFNKKILRLIAWFFLFKLVVLIILHLLITKKVTLNIENDEMYSYIMDSENEKDKNYLCKKVEFEYNNKDVLKKIFLDFNRQKKAWYDCDATFYEKFIEPIRIRDIVYDKIKNNKSLVDKILIQNSLINIKNDEIYQVSLNKSAFTRQPSLFNLSSFKGCSCSFQLFDKVYNVSEKIITYIGKQFIFSNDFNNAIYLNTFGFYYLNCTKNNRTFFENIYSILPYNMSLLIENRKPKKVLERKFLNRIFNNANHTREYLNAMLKSSLYKNCQIDKQEVKKMNVLMLSIDSVSYNQLRREFPNTYKYLKNSFSRNVLFDSFNIVGENTFPNLLALLGGILASPIPELNLTEELQFYNSLDEHYDHYPLIWKEYEDLGYLTTFSEDIGCLGAFNYMKKGFNFQPVHYYLRPYWVKKCHILNYLSSSCVSLIVIIIEK